MTNTLKAPKPEPEAPPLGSPLLRFYRSSLGKKLITGTTGLALVVFVLAHLAGNLLLFSGREAYNAYARAIESLGVAFYAVELGLVVVVLLLVLLLLVGRHLVLAVVLLGQARSGQGTRWELVVVARLLRPSRRSGPTVRAPRVRRVERGG